MKKYLFILFILYSAQSFSQSAQLTPINNANTHQVTVGVPAKYAKVFPANKTLKVHSNYTASIFHIGGLSKPRFMAFSPNGILHVSDMNAGIIYALPDAKHDGIADTMYQAATGFAGNHDVKFYKNAMYVTEPTKIWKCTDLNADGVYETKSIFIDNINNNTGGHTTRTLVFDSINKKVYVSIGSWCNVCRETNPRAIIEQYEEDGSGKREFASGVRNAVGMAMHPVTNKLWANNNGSDNQGNEIPPEWIDIVRDQGFYGHPFAYSPGMWFNFDANPAYKALLPITALDSAKVATMVKPAALIRAHSAPMALHFLGSEFGKDLQHGFLSAMHGSWNTTNPKDYRGYKVIYGHLSSAQDSTVDYISDFCSGFITDTVNRVLWGRPVGIATDKTGRVYISSDSDNMFILVLSPDSTTGINNQNYDSNWVSFFPNPAKNQLNIKLSLNQTSSVNVKLCDMFGRPLKEINYQQLSNGTHYQSIDIIELEGGCYFLNIRANNKSISQKLVILD